MYMASGVFLFFAVAIFMLIAVVNPRWMFSVQTNKPLPQDHLRATPEERREATIQAFENLLKDKSPEEKAEFLKKFEEKAEAKAEAQQKEAAARKNKAVMFHWIVTIFRVLMILPISMLSFFGSLCLMRVLRYFRDYLELSVDQGSLVVQRPKLLGGVSMRVLPLREISKISCYAVQRRRYQNVQWHVVIDSTHSLRNRLQFVVEHIPGHASLDRPTERVRVFAEAIQAMTRASSARAHNPRL